MAQLTAMVATGGFGVWGIQAVGWVIERVARASERVAAGMQAIGETACENHLSALVEQLAAVAQLAALARLAALAQLAALT